MTSEQDKREEFSEEELERIEEQWVVMRRRLKNCLANMEKEQASPPPPKESSTPSTSPPKPTQ